MGLTPCNRVPTINNFLSSRQLFKKFVKTWESFEIKKVKQITTQFNFALNFAKNHIIYLLYKKMNTRQTKLNQNENFRNKFMQKDWLI